MNKIISKPFLETLFIRQNEYHKSSVLGHTFKVFLSALIFKKFDFLMATLLHDIGKPYTAYKDEKDIISEIPSWSFTNHEEISYQLIKNIPFISNKTKMLVRYHYIIRDMKKSKEKNKIGRYKRLKRMWNKLDEDFKKDLYCFLIFDDLGKSSYKNIFCNFCKEDFCKD